MARSATFFGAVPVMMNPPIITFSPFATRIRVEMLTAFGAHEVGDGEGDALAVTDGDGLAVADGDGEADA